MSASHRKSSVAKARWLWLLAPALLAACSGAPSRDAMQTAVNAAIRDQLQAQLPMLQLTGRAQEAEIVLRDPKFGAKIADQKCNRIGEDKYRCDVLLDFREANQIATADAEKAAGGKPGADDGKGPMPDQLQDTFVLTKLGGTWRADEVKP